MKHEQAVRYEDVAGVKSRVSWGAIIAGSVVTLASYLVLSLLLAGVGLSITEAGANGRNVGLGTVLAGVFCMGLALFAGGWVATQMTAGETWCESVVYGILTWATVTALSVGMVGMGARAGYHGLLNATYVAQNNTNQSWETLARRAGVSQEQIDKVKENTTPEKVGEAVNDPENQENARKALMIATWTTLVATILGASCAVAGALVGSGPQFRLIPSTRVRREEVSVNV